MIIWVGGWKACQQERYRFFFIRVISEVGIVNNGVKKITVLK